jgi:murein L,D-transpeptidase YcbB/YkuD
MSYYLAPSLEKLRDEIDKKFPNRDKTSDGWIGDTSHAARPSDHNPDWSAGGVVRAIDVDIDDNTPQNLRKQLVNAAIKDNRTYYVISNGYIYSRTYGFAKRRYTGDNGHFHHVHISIRSGRVYENNIRSWMNTTLPRVSVAVVLRQANAKKKRVTLAVKRVQRALGIKADGIYGDGTRDAFRKFEREYDGTGDGLPDRENLKRLGKGRFKVVK